MATKKKAAKAAKKAPAPRRRVADAGDDTPDPLAAAASRARIKPAPVHDEDDADDLDALQDDGDHDDELDPEVADVPDYVTDAIDKQRRFADQSDVEIVHMIYRHVGGTRHGARELAGRIEDVAVLEQADVADRFGGGFYSCYSYFRRSNGGEDRVAWTCRVSSSYQAKSPPAARIAPGVALPSQLAESVALLDQLSIIAERMGGKQREQSPVEAMGKMMEGVMQVLGTTMRTAVKYQGDRALEQLRDGGAPATLPPAAPASGFGLRDLWDAVGGLEGVMNLWGQLKNRQSTPPAPGDTAP